MVVENNKPTLRQAVTTTFAAAIAGAFGGDAVAQDSSPEKSEKPTANSTMDDVLEDLFPDAAIEDIFKPSASKEESVQETAKEETVESLENLSLSNTGSPSLRGDTYYVSLTPEQVLLVDQSTENAAQKAATLIVQNLKTNADSSSIKLTGPQDTESAFTAKQNEELVRIVAEALRRTIDSSTKSALETLSQDGRLVLNLEQGAVNFAAGSVTVNLDITIENMGGVAPSVATPVFTPQTNFAPVASVPFQQNVVQTPVIQGQVYDQSGVYGQPGVIPNNMGSSTRSNPPMPGSSTRTIPMGAPSNTTYGNPVQDMGCIPCEGAVPQQQVPQPPQQQFQPEQQGRFPRLRAALGRVPVIGGIFVRGGDTQIIQNQRPSVKQPHQPHSGRMGRGNQGGMRSGNRGGRMNMGGSGKKDDRNGKNNH